MSRTSLSNRLAAAAGRPVEVDPAQQDRSLPASAKARAGKTMVAGYFSPELAKAIKMLAAEREVTVQALVGEGLDAVLRLHGKHPMGER